MTFAEEAEALTKAAIAKQETVDPLHIARVKDLIKEAAISRLYERTITVADLITRNPPDLAVLGRCCERDLGVKAVFTAERHPGGKQELKISWYPAATEQPSHPNQGGDGNCS